MSKHAEKTKKDSWYINSRRQGDLRFDIVLIVVMALLTLIVFYPMYLVVISSFSSPEAVYSGKVLLWPSGSNTKGFENVLKTSELWTGYANSIYYTVVGTVINLFCTLTGAFVLSRDRFALHKPLSIMIVITMFFGGGMIPSYLLVKSLGFLNKVWAVTVPAAISTWNLMVTRSFFVSSIPEELHESAEIDGCNNIQFFVHVALPLSTTIIVVMGLFYAVGHWNNYFSAMLYITDKDKYPLQLVLRNLLLNAEYAVKNASENFDYDEKLVKEMYAMAESMKYIIVLLTVLPIVVVFPFVEKYFVKGVMVGSLKG